jgi:uncharacterized protein
MHDRIKILNKLKIDLTSVLGDKILQVILFGSWLRNEGNAWSDLDVLIVTSEILTWKEKSVVRDVCYDISVDFEILVDSKIISQYEIENSFWGKHPLITDALKSGIYAE